MDSNNNKNNNRRTPSSPSQRSSPSGLLHVRKAPPFTSNTTSSVSYRKMTPTEAAAAAAIRRQEQGTTRTAISRSPVCAIASPTGPSPTTAFTQQAAGAAFPSPQIPPNQQQPPEQQQDNTPTVAVEGCTKVEGSLSHIGDMVDLLSSEVFVMAQELLASPEGWDGSGTDGGGGQCRYTQKLEKARLSLEVNVNELSEDLDDIRVKSLLPLYSHIKKLIHGRLDLLELYTKHRLAHLIIHNNSSSTTPTNSSSSNCCYSSSSNCGYNSNTGGTIVTTTLQRISELEDRTASLGADIQNTFSNSLPPPLLANNLSKNINHLSSINWPDSVCTSLRAKQRYWLQQVNNICLDVDEFAVSIITSKDESPTSSNINEESLVVKEVGCRKRSLYSKLDIIETLVQSMKFPTSLLLPGGSSMPDNIISEWSCAWWMLSETTRPILEARLYNNNN
eukprot:GHVS01019156.1.p1 GENE.GHVS01019156.1~~GHVS01019156.1.p1  ORF type:complete len:448 (+),score=121.81 GHVS01019156.1:216-1559(+)